MTFWVMTNINKMFFFKFNLQAPLPDFSFLNSLIIIYYVNTFLNIRQKLYLYSNANNNNNNNK